MHDKWAPTQALNEQCNCAKFRGLEGAAAAPSPLLCTAVVSGECSVPYQPEVSTAFGGETYKLRTASTAATTQTQAATELDIESAIYERISDELESKSPLDKGIWTKAFSVSGGDEPKARAAYITFRFEKIRRVELSRLAAEKLEQEAEANAKEASRQRLEVERLRFEKLALFERVSEKIASGVTACLSATTDAATFLNAVKQGNLAQVSSMLMKNYLFVAVVDDIGRTPLHLAALERNILMAKILVDAGASLDQANIFGLTAKSLLGDNNMQEVIEYQLALLQCSGV